MFRFSTIGPLEEANNHRRRHDDMQIHWGRIFITVALVMFWYCVFKAF